MRRLEQLVNEANQNGQPKKKPEVKKPVYIRESEERLMDKFGTGVSIREKKDNKGKIEIEYLSLEDLTRILDILEIDFDA